MKYVSVAAVGLCRLFFVFFLLVSVPRFLFFPHDIFIISFFLLSIAACWLQSQNKNINRFTTYHGCRLDNNTQFIIVDRRRELDQIR